MTTIAYRDGVLAADGQSTDSDDVVLCETTKVGRRGRFLFGASGESAWAQTFRAWASGGFQGGCPRSAEAEGKASGFVIDGDLLLEWWPTGQFTRTHLVAGMHADGSGKKLALGAMAAGASPEEAVHIAARFDVYTGGPVTVVRRPR